MSKATLYVFSISHYCEKAKWALDICNIEYELKVLIPPTYAKATQHLDTAKPSVPILQTPAGEVIQGSPGIVVWANSQNEKFLVSDESNHIERRLDAALGLHIRRWFYSESLIDCPKIVKPCFTFGAHFLDKILMMFAWSKVVPVMIQRMDLGPAQELESKAIVERELAWLEEKLADGRKYLVDGQFSNADIAAASLLAPAFSIKEHPLNSVFTLPTRISATCESWSGRPIEQWLKRIYKEHRWRENTH